MHSIEDAAKPSLEQLIMDQHVILDADEQQKLASLICLVTMRAEFLDRKFGIPKSDRDFLRENGSPPGHWRIWIARFIGTRPGDYWYNRFAMQLGPRELLSSTEFGSGAVPAYNSQSSTFVWGKFCCIAISSTYLTELKGYDESLPRIWPICVPIIDNVGLPMLDDRGVAMLGDAMAKSFMKQGN